jgi:hypothetical protein
VPLGVSGVAGLSLCRVGSVVLAPGSGEARVVWLGAEPARLERLHRLSLLLRLSARLGDLCLSLAGSRGPARLTGSVVAASGAGSSSWPAR